jgi:hypothetical protein
MGAATNGFDLGGCLQAAAEIEAELTRLTNELTEAQFHAPTRAGGWSVGYCIEHLVLTGHAFLPKWDLALKECTARECRCGQAFRYAWWQRKALQLVENPSRLKQKTTAPLVPCFRHSIDETVGRFRGMHQELVLRLARCRGLDVSRIKVQSPFVAWVRYTLGFSFDLALAHERRHLRQAWLVRRQLPDGH